MKVVLDTNVFVSGVYFSGPPHAILNAWREGKVELVVSAAIMQEYYRVAGELAEQFPVVDLTPWVELVAAHARFVESPSLPEAVCADADDDKFLACALAGRVRIVITGDKMLIKPCGYRGIQVLTPRRFLVEFLGG